MHANQAYGMVISYHILLINGSEFAILKMVVVILCVNSGHGQCSFSGANLETFIRGQCLFIAGTEGSEQEEGADCSVA